MEVLAFLLLLAFGVVAAMLLLFFVMVPLFKGVGYAIGGVFRLIGWLIMHVFNFVSGMLTDSVRLVGAIIAMIVFLPFVPLNIVIARWSAATHFATSIKREMKVAGLCLYRIALQRPLRFVLLHGLLEGIEQRVPEAMAAAPRAERPRRRAGQFEGYEIVGSLPGGGSGAKLYIAKPDEANRRRGLPERVVIKSFAVSEGSSLPQIVRESRALEAARQLGLVLDHGMDERRFFYIMPYHPGENLSVLTRQLHGESGESGLAQSQLRQVMSYVQDLLATLSAYHRGGLWHKDVKPENVIVHDRRAHLVDLGLVTPLRSAMTLTTHGTEYFRDPEMVRQALRGVKVHQVDGTKFDIYAAGAVLYFMLENTFPAHGGLSRFGRKSPEALRWIVRRAMADYNQRYASVDMMLADLRAVAHGSDAFKVRPVDLPSMRGEDAVAADAFNEPEEEVAFAAGAGSPVPPRNEDAPAEDENVRGFGVAAGIGAAGPFAQVGRFEVDPQGNAVRTQGSPTPPKTGRPKLRVTNWWTGQYVVDPEGQAVHQEAVRASARDLRHDVQEIKQAARQGSITAARAAREQVRAARQRAREIRDRTREKLRTRHAAVRAPGEKPSPFVWALVGIVVLGVIGGAKVLRETLNRPRSFNNATVIFDTPSADKDRLPLLLMVDAERFSDRQLRLIIEDHEGQGYEIVKHKNLATELVDVVHKWWDDQEGPANVELERVFAANRLYGVLYVTRDGRDLNSEILYSESPDARNRRWAGGSNVPAPTSDLPLLVINDNPSKFDPKVEERVMTVVRQYESAGWTVVEDDAAEAEIRLALPTGTGELEQGYVPPALERAIQEGAFSGLLLITAEQGEEPAHERVAVHLIEAPEAEIES